MADPLTTALLDKIVEQVERTEHLIASIPADLMNWVPPMSRSWTTAELLWHLVGCQKGFCAVLYAIEPERLAHLQALREDERYGDAKPGKIAGMIGGIKEKIVSGFALVNDSTLARRIPTVFVPQGESVLTLFLGNLEHLINHKHQLFTYLRLMDVNVESRDLYRFRP